MKNVTIRRQNGPILGTFRSLPITNKVLEEKCAAFGAGVYVASWPNQENIGDGKKRKSTELSKKIYVYADGDFMPTRNAGEQAQPMAGLTTLGYQRQQIDQIDQLRKLFEDGAEKVTRPVVEKVDALTHRLSIIEALMPNADNIAEAEEEEEEEEEEIAMLEKLFTLARQPKYAQLSGVLFSLGDDQEKFRQIDQIMQSNPALMHELIMDLINLAINAFKDKI